MSTPDNSTLTRGIRTWHLWAITGAAASFIALVLILYFIYFGDIVPDNDKWGTFGDYFGGTLNPLLSFLALIALLYTIHIQSKELRLSREELEATRAELEKSANAAKKQSEYFEREERRADTYKIIDMLASRINNNINSDRLPSNVSLHSILYQRHNIVIGGSTIPDGISVLCKWRDKKNALTLSLIRWLESDLKRLMKYLDMYEKISGKGRKPRTKGWHLFFGDRYTTPLPDFYIDDFGYVTHVLYENKMLPKELHDYYCKECKATENKQG